MAGFAVEIDQDWRPGDQAMCAVDGAGNIGLPAEMEWHTDMYLDELGPEWQAVYTRAGHVVTAERAWGGGSIVVVTDGYHFSNEALQKDPRPGFLAWCLDRPRVVFDETHLGVAGAPGPADLLRKYRLHGFLAGLLILAGLYIWKNAAALVRPQDEEAVLVREARSTRDSTAGLISLLARSVPQKKLAAACLAEWRKTTNQPDHGDDARLDAAGADPDPVAGYNEINRILTEGKRAWRK